VDDLAKRYFLEAARQTGASTSNDYISNDYIAPGLHNFYRQRLFNMYSTVPNAAPINELPDYTTEAFEDLGQGSRILSQLAF
jgi:hypothetical protein